MKRLFALQCCCGLNYGECEEPWKLIPGGGASSAQLRYQRPRVASECVRPQGSSWAANGPRYAPTPNRENDWRGMRIRQGDGMSEEPAEQDRRRSPWQWVAMLPLAVVAYMFSLGPVGWAMKTLVVRILQGSHSQPEEVCMSLLTLYCAPAECVLCCYDPECCRQYITWWWRL